MNVVNVSQIFFDPVLLSLVALMVAIVAAWAVLRICQDQFDKQNRELAIKPGRETATRIVTPVNADVGGFIEVIGGDEALIGKMIPLFVQTATLAGRSVEHAELVFNLHHTHSVVSRLHCEFHEVNGIYRVRDIGSTQGTFVNGMRLQAGGDGQVLLEGDRIELGPAERGGVVLCFHSARIRLVQQVLT